MQRSELEHILAAAAQVVKSDVFVVIGSQAILGTFEDPPESLLQSMEADIYVPDAPEKSDLIDGVFGDGSNFHLAFGFYAHGVGPETAKPPLGWQDRLVRLEIPPRPGSTVSATALCLEMHDLVLSKCYACRERDWDYARDTMRAGLVDRDTLLRRLPTMPLDAERERLIRQMLMGM
ncbi:DUF6036 family nucleotidyltransferase [Patulibacter americanus]|uniref:DUF6036 family nucleotidyltransferase n=1 Tax=Patulibacter americanus TaxID=588672 RepID=UPI0003B72874|nr:DUF6036 family nucleotidyltransferase [Patulibacter americanus]